MIDTTALRARNLFLSSDSARDACEATDELDRLRGALASADAAFSQMEDRANGLSEKLSTARALAMEEAARLCSDIGMASPANVEVALLEQSRRFRSAIRALAPLPTGLVAVPRETLEQWYQALEYDEKGEADVRAALSALVKP